MNFLEYNINGNYCEQCPYGSTGNYPNCVCDGTGYFHENYCKYCPWGANGTYPNCTCEEDEAYIQEKDVCLKCPIERYENFASVISFTFPMRFQMTGRPFVVQKNFI